MFHDRRARPRRGGSNCSSPPSSATEGSRRSPTCPTRTRSATATASARAPSCAAIKAGQVHASRRSARRRGPAPAAAVCKKLVKGLIEAVAGGVKADPSESWYVPAVPLDKPTLVAAVQRARTEERVGGAARTRHRRGREEQERPGVACSRALWGDGVHRRARRPVHQRPRPRQHPEGRHVLASSRASTAGSRRPTTSSASARWRRSTTCRW